MVSRARRGAAGPRPGERDHREVCPFPTQIELAPIAIVRSPYQERHGTPRQPSFGDEVRAEIELLPHLSPDLLKDLDSFSYIWVISWMHLNGPRLNPLVRPPRGGPKRGALSTRAPHRPNPIALSCVSLLKVSGRSAEVQGLDLISGTPILDLKPYIPDFDSQPTATRGWLEEL